MDDDVLLPRDAPSDTRELAALRAAGVVPPLPVAPRVPRAQPATFARALPPNLPQGPAPVGVPDPAAGTPPTPPPAAADASVGGSIGSSTVVTFLPPGQGPVMVEPKTVTLSEEEQAAADVVAKPNA
jgi:hypothetical protein